MEKIDVLDHGFVRLVDSMGGDLAVCRAARVSYDGAWRAGEDEGSDARLIRRLWKDRHSSPFEAVEFQFEVMAPIFVFRQWHRHRTWSFNELSARYRELPESFYIPEPDKIGIQSKANKQGRELADMQPDEFMELRNLEAEALRAASETAFALYRSLLASEWPRELARLILPVNTYSHMFAKTNLRNLLAFFDLRVDSHAQYEIRAYAEALLALARGVAPVCIEAWEAGRG